MILVILGTQDKPFTRLLKAIQKQIDKGNIKQKVVVQAGCTKFESKDMEIFDLIPTDEFNKLVKEADLIITHGGVGSILEGVKNNKKILAAPRLKKYGEHVNDHQLQIIDEFVDMGYILPLKDFNKLDKMMKKAQKFKPKEFISNTSNVVALLESYIDNL
ncbi:MAG TPA: exopolysaccharide biosynthesis protein [Mollicutes bacterium]|nr:exopolysaccharide biosynthesis protein [Mollicutes bacterium]